MVEEAKDIDKAIIERRLQLLERRVQSLENDMKTDISLPEVWAEVQRIKDIQRSPDSNRGR